MCGRGSNHRLAGSPGCWCFCSSFQWSWCLMLSKRSKNVARLLDWTQLHKFWSFAGLEPRNTGGLMEPLHSGPSLTTASNTWVCYYSPANIFPFISFFFKTTGDKAYSAVKMNFCPDSIDFPFVFSFPSWFQRKRKKCREEQSLSQVQQLGSPLV